MTNEKPEFIDEQENFPDEQNDLSVDDFLEGEGNYIKSPEVGAFVEFQLKGIKKQPAKRIKNPKTDKMMDITLSSVDYYYEFLTEDGKVFSVTSWQIVGKTKAILKKLGKYGITLRVEHSADGMKAAKGVEAWKIYTEIKGKFVELDRDTNEWK